MKDADAKKNGSRPQPVYIDSLGDDDAKQKSPEYIKRKGKISRFYTWCMEKTLPQKKKFAAGLIGFPIFVLVLSFLLVFISELLTTHESDESQKLESININGDTYVVHEFQMPPEFQNDYPSNNYWRVTVYFGIFGEEKNSQKKHAINMILLLIIAVQFGIRPKETTDMTPICRLTAIKFALRVLQTPRFLPKLPIIGKPIELLPTFFHSPYTFGQFLQFL